MLAFFRSQTARRPPQQTELARAEVPELRGAEIAAVFYGQRMAGDYYDFLRVGPSRVLFGMLDVAGRRSDNQEILAAAQATFRNGGAELFRGEDINEADAMIELCVRLNRTIIEASKSVCSCPAFVGCYNEALGTVCYVNAGHTPGLLHDSLGTELLPATGLPLGLFSHMPADAKIVGLAPGATLLIVSRGIVDATCKGEDFGLERVKQCFPSDAPVNARDLSAGIIASVQQFLCKPPTHDDVTALSLIRAKAMAAEQESMSGV
jgi:serine phosphatase RsbU (regulator of sigma subunit)